MFRFFNGWSFRTTLLQSIARRRTCLNRFFNGRSFRTEILWEKHYSCLSQPFFQRQVLSDTLVYPGIQRCHVSTVFSTAGPFGRRSLRQGACRSGVSTVFSTAGPFGQGYAPSVTFWDDISTVFSTAGPFGQKRLLKETGVLCLNRFFNGRSFRTFYCIVEKPTIKSQPFFQRQVLSD